MRSVEGRLAKLERETKAQAAAPDKPCICPFGQQSFYFTVEGMTDAEVAAKLPENRRHCPKCGGLNTPVAIDAEELGV